MRLRIVLLLVIVAALVWSFRTPARPTSTRPTPPPPDAPPELATHYERAQCGSLTGTVLWEGPVPEVPPFKPQRTFFTPEWLGLQPNPNAIDVRDGRLENAVVFLRHVAPTKSKPWAYDPVTVELEGYDLRIRQGERRGRVGFIQQGAALAMVALDRPLGTYSLRGHGASFFTHMLAEPKVVTRRPLPQPGLVELSSGGEYVWARGYLFVTPHPYYTLTDRDGQFTLSDVPAGNYELVCWKPNWHIAERDRDPELLVHTRVRYHAPVEHTREVRVTAGQTTTVRTFAFDAKDFQPK